MAKRKECLTGKIFGNLRVLEDTGEEKVLCECLLCGNKKKMNRYNIQKHERISAGDACGCKMRQSCKDRAKALADKNDLSGKLFPGIEILEKTGEVKGTQRVYRCKCLHCGKIFETRGASITRGDTTSCGCQKIKKAIENITKDCVDGTKISAIAGKMRTDNTSGVKGVSQKKNGYWTAYIGFKGKRYTLYQGPDKEEAIKRREAAEQEMHGEFLKWYNDNKSK